MQVVSAFELDAERRHAIATYVIMAKTLIVVSSNGWCQFILPDLGIIVEFPEAAKRLTWADNTPMNTALTWREDCLQVLLRP